MVTTLDIVDQLVEVYFKEEWWQEPRISREEAYKYHKIMYDKGNILIYEEEGVVLGYLEFWRINFTQFGRLICHEHFNACREDVTNGNLAYVANTWVNKEHRKSNVFKLLKLKFFESNYLCDYFVGEALRKKTQPVKVFKRSQLRSKLFTEGVSHG